MASCHESADMEDVMDMFCSTTTDVVLEVHENTKDVVIGQGLGIGRAISAVDCPITFQINVQGTYEYRSIL